MESDFNITQPSTQNSIIGFRRHPRIKEKLNIWKLIKDSYEGGEVYIKGNHLDQYVKETNPDFENRLKRSVRINYVRPLADILAGFIYKTKPERKIPPDLEFLVERTSRKKGLDAFMHNLSIQSLLKTTGILIDSPNFDSNIIKTKKDQVSNNLNPFVVMYDSSRIRDFSVDSDNNLEWVLLDNSMLDNSDINKESTIKKVYRMWTKEIFVDYTFTEKDKKEEITKGQEISHNLGEVPFRFVNWIDQNEDYISESIFEDISLLDRKLYNDLSYLDEMLAAGTFKMLFWPGSKDTVDKAIIRDGVSNLSLVCYPPDGSHEPEFKGASLSETNPYIEIMRFLLREMYGMVGLDNNPDREHMFHQSGEAADKEFEKTETILRMGAIQLQEAEQFIFKMASKWQSSKSYEKSKVTYSTEFQTEDVDLQLNRLYKTAESPFDSIVEQSWKDIVQIVFINEDPKQMKTLVDSVKIEDNTQTDLLNIDEPEVQIIQEKEIP